MTKPLAGKKIAVLVESEYIPGEIAAYENVFGYLGAEVDFVSRLWGNREITFVSDVETAGQTPQLLTVKKDLADIVLDDYAALLMAANYTSVRLRYFDPPLGQTTTAAMVTTAPAVQLFARAMQDRCLINSSSAPCCSRPRPPPHRCDSAVSSRARRRGGRAVGGSRGASRVRAVRVAPRSAAS